MTGDILNEREFSEEENDTMASIVRVNKDYTLVTNLITFSFGIIGNLLNILMFTKLKIFRNNQCIFYLLAESFVDIVSLIYYFIIRFLSSQYGSDLTAYSTIWCKLKTMMGQILLLFPLSIICFAAFDQFLSTNFSPYVRQMSTLKLARRLIFLSLCFSLVHSIGFGIFFYARPPVDCVLSYQILTDYYSYFFYPIFCGILPIFIAGLFSLLAYQNVRRITRRQLPILRRRLDQQLTKFVLTRVTFLIILLGPFVIYRAYAINTNISPTDSFRLAIEGLILATVGSIFNLNYAVKFDFFFDFEEDCFFF